MSCLSSTAGVLIFQRKQNCKACSGQIPPQSLFQAHPKHGKFDVVRRVLPHYGGVTGCRMSCPGQEHPYTKPAPLHFGFKANWEPLQLMAALRHALHLSWAGKSAKADSLFFKQAWRSWEITATKLPAITSQRCGAACQHRSSHSNKAQPGKGAQGWEPLSHCKSLPREAVPASASLDVSRARLDTAWNNLGKWKVSWFGVRWALNAFQPRAFCGSLKQNPDP